MDHQDTICAIATPPGSSAIAVVRLSGDRSIEILSMSFSPLKDGDLHKTNGGRIRFGNFYKTNEKIDILDEVLVSIFKSPHSYTGEESVEISCHGSNYIVQEILIQLISNGARLAEPGEFTQRAFISGKLDLAQAEAVADLIMSETETSHNIAIRQLKGGFSDELSMMRSSLLDIVSLMELELDFSEEDVEFADRDQLNALINKVTNHIGDLIESFKLGNVIKNGVPVAIVGATNTGKSTLLNTLLGEERAIVSNIHGTTRDSIEDTINLGGISFRFIDTAGIRSTQETIEIIGIERTYSKMQVASIVIMVLDSERPEDFSVNLDNLSKRLTNKENKQVIILLNKVDVSDIDSENKTLELISMIKDAVENTDISPISIMPISAKYKMGSEQLKDVLIESQKSLKTSPNATLVTNARHYQALLLAEESLGRVSNGLKQGTPTDLLAQDIRETLYHIGSITGEISNDEILGNIFANFCIGK